jgi:hypothetical protein
MINTLLAVSLDACQGLLNLPGCGGGGVFDKGGVFTKVANFLILVTGVVAVIMLIIGGLRYVISGGNPQATKGAKDTILYAIIGLVVVIAAWAIVNFVVGRFK